MSVLKVKEVEASLRKHDGNMAAVGREFGVTRSAVHKFVTGNPTLRAVCDECREGMTDEAESSLFKAVKNGDAWAVCFYLKCQAKGRGYVEKPADLPPLETLLGALDPETAALVRKALADAIRTGGNSGGGTNGPA